MRWINAIFWGVFSVAVVSHGYAETIIYRGSSTIGQFMHDAAAVYQQVSFDINTKSESAGGENAAATGKTDIGGVARDVRKEILDQGAKPFLIGKDAIGILVNPDNPVTVLSMDQIARIFSGDITNWKEVGGEDREIDVFIVNPRSATRSVMQKKVLGKRTYGGKRIRTIRPDVRIIGEVLKNPGGIGQLSFAFLMGADVKLIHPDGEKPEVANPNYPITRNLYLVTKGTPTGKTNDFIQWVLSPEGQQIVKQRFIGIH